MLMQIACHGLQISNWGRDSKDASQPQELSIDESVKAVCQAACPFPFIECLPCDAAVIDKNFGDEDLGQDICSFTNRNWRSAQSGDPFLASWMRAVREGRKPKKGTASDCLMMAKVFHQLQFDNGVLTRVTNVDGLPRKQIVLPSRYVEDVLQGLSHNNVGHPGRDKTLSLLRDRFFWPGMAKDTEEYIKNCQRCILRKTPSKNIRAPLLMIRSSRVLLDSMLAKFH